MIGRSSTNRTAESISRFIAAIVGSVLVVVLLLLIAPRTEQPYVSVRPGVEEAKHMDANATVAISDSNSATVCEFVSNLAIIDPVSLMLSCP